MERSSQHHTSYFPVVCLGFAESETKLSLSGRWSVLLAHVGLHLKVLGKIRCDSWIPEVITAGNERQLWRAIIFLIASPSAPLFLSWLITKAVAFTSPLAHPSYKISASPRISVAPVRIKQCALGQLPVVMSATH